MAARPNYYEVLGIAHNAKLTDVTRAYNRWVADFKKDTTPPDPRRESLLKEALEVLSDDARRDAYDREMADELAAAKRKGRAAPVLPLAIGATVVVAAVAIYFAMRSDTPAGPKPRTAQEIHQSMSGSVSALVALDMTGKVTPMGAAFVIADKVMVANCQALAPGAQLMITSGAKQMAARVSVSDPELGLCKLATDGYVGEPIAFNPTPPAAGAKVFATSLNAQGDVVLKEATVTKVVDEAGGKAILASIAGTPLGSGAPLLDMLGKVVAVTTLQADGRAIHRVIPPGWLEDNRPRVAEPRPYQGDPATAAAPATPSAAPGTAEPPSMLSHPTGLRPPKPIEKGIDDAYRKRIEATDKQVDGK